MPHLHAKVKYFPILTGETKKSHEQFLLKLRTEIPHLQEVFTEDECSVVLVFCPIVSRCGTDLGEAVDKLNETSHNKKAVIIVLHHTFDPDKCVPDSSRTVTRKNTLTVDCLFHEDKGFLECVKNKEAVNKTVQYITEQKQASARPSRAPILSEAIESQPLQEPEKEDNNTEQDQSGCCQWPWDLFDCFCCCWPASATSKMETLSEGNNQQPLLPPNTGNNNSDQNPWGCNCSCKCFC